MYENPYSIQISVGDVYKFKTKLLTKNIYWLCTKVETKVDEPKSYSDYEYYGITTLPEKKREIILEGRSPEIIIDIASDWIFAKKKKDERSFYYYGQKHLMPFSLVKKPKYVSTLHPLSDRMIKLYEFMKEFDYYQSLLNHEDPYGSVYCYKDIKSLKEQEQNKYLPLIERKAEFFWPITEFGEHPIFYIHLGHIFEDCQLVIIHGNRYLERTNIMPKDLNQHLLGRLHYNEIKAIQLMYDLKINYFYPTEDLYDLIQRVTLG